MRVLHSSSPRKMDPCAFYVDDHCVFMAVLRFIGLWNLLASQKERRSLDNGDTAQLLAERTEGQKDGWMHDGWMDGWILYYHINRLGYCFLYITIEDMNSIRKKKY